MRPFVILFAGATMLAAVLLQVSGSRAGPAQTAALTATSQSVRASRLEPAIPERASAVVKPETWASELFYVRPQGARGVLAAYDMASGRQRHVLPAGMLAPDGKHYYTASAFPNEGQLDTSLTIYDPAAGLVESQFVLEGQWELSGVSQTGRWLALTRVPGAADREAWARAKVWKTDVQILDSSSGKVSHAMNLDGNFEVETISPSGDALFLVEHLPPVNPEKYRIRLYDLVQERLQAGVLRDKVAADEVMAGLAWEGVATPDGRWLLTLYLSTGRNTAFIHTLDLKNRVPVCIDLPSGKGDFSKLKYYSLALSPDGYKVYATNAALGVVTAVSLYSRQVTRVVNFEPESFGVRLDENPQNQTSRSVVSKDGTKVYFTSGWDVWAYDTAAGKVDGPFLVNTPIAGLGLSGDGKRLYVATADDTLQVFDTQTGHALRFPATAVLLRNLN